MNQKLIFCSGTSPSIYSVDYQAPHHTVTKLKSPPCKYYVEILGSFNGIVLLRMVSELCLWNPSVKLYQKFSPTEGEYAYIKYGLCHDSVSDDFKVVSVNLRLSDSHSSIQMFTSKLGSWKRIGDFGYFLINTLPMAVLNGPPHWVARVAGGDNSNFINAIVCFDTAEEKFKEVPIPKNFEGGNICIDLGVLIWVDGFVEFTTAVWESDSDVWVMKEYGVKESWIKLFVVPNVLGEFCFRCIRVLGYRKDGEVVMVLNSTDLVIYDPKQNRYNRIEIHLDCRGLMRLFIWRVLFHLVSTMALARRHR